MSGPTSYTTEGIPTFDQLSPATTKGDLIAYSTTNARLPVGSNDQVLTADSTQTLGVKWATPTTTTVLTAPYDIQNYSISTSVAANALTIALKDANGSDPSSGSPVKVSFRSSTLNNSTYTSVSITGALSIVVPSGATLGHANGVDEKIYVYLINNSGTAELAVSGGSFFQKGTRFTTTTIDTNSDSRTVAYSTTGRTSVGGHIAGIISVNQATAGTWASATADIWTIPQQPEPPVVSSRTDAQPSKVCSALITNAGTAAISRQDGSWISSVSRTGAGTVEVNITAGTFSSAPNYMAITANGNTNKSACITTHSITQVVVQCNTNTAGAGSDNDFFIYAIGPA